MWIKNKRFHSGEALQSLNSFQSFPLTIFFLSSCVFSFKLLQAHKINLNQIYIAQIYILYHCSLSNAIMKWSKKVLLTEEQFKEWNYIYFPYESYYALTLLAPAKLNEDSNDKMILSYKTRILTCSNRQIRKWNGLFYISFSVLLLPKQTRVLVYRVPNKTLRE